MSSIVVGPSFAGSRVAVRRPARRPTRPASRPVRLTRRGRVVVTLLFLAALMVVFTVLGGHSAATGESGVPVKTRTVEVGEGDTLWGIASRVAAPGQTREMVHQIEELNALPGPSLAEGQRIAVPVR
jgi:hypothetical protein